MKAADWIVDFLLKNGVTDVFGLPGAVALELLYAMDRRKPNLTPHLNYHEQGAAFAACGYAQATGKLGVAYSTRGPGLTNMVTAIADAYYDSIPTMFLTAHSSAELRSDMRILNNQEMDTVAVVSGFTKYAVRIDNVEALQQEVKKAYRAATEGRPGPVFLDILSSSFNAEVGDTADDDSEGTPSAVQAESNKIAAQIAENVRAAHHPVILIGSGVRQAGVQAQVRQLAERFSIPVLSSRTSEDIMPDSGMYFGYVGSHATRYSNFIISKADLIVALGNRMYFPVNSKSFRPIVEKSFTIRVDVDESEFSREVPNSVKYAADLRGLLPELLKQELAYSGQSEWLTVCRELEKALPNWDTLPVIDQLMQIMGAAGEEATFVCDVGNHSFWATNAHAYSHATNRILYSGSFGSLGSALPKSIGAYYSTGKPVLCFVGDQGLQMNIQELQFISQHRLPITIVVLNNQSSGMIREREMKRPHFVHTTRDSGYDYPNLRDIAGAYRLEYQSVELLTEDAGTQQISLGATPCLIELKIDEKVELHPNLPQGCACQDLAPALPRELYSRLNELI